MASGTASPGTGSAPAALRKGLGPQALSDLERGSIVVLPSITFPPDELRKISGIQYYEERLLFSLLWLERPDMKIVYVTSVPIDDAVVQYYLGFLDDPAAASKRLHLVSLHDPSIRSLSEKLLERDDAIEEIRRAVAGDDLIFVLPFNVTSFEKEIADRLDIPLYGPALEHLHFGSKTGARLMAAEAGVEVPDGAEGLRSLPQIEAALTELVARRRDLGAVVIKLNNGFSGQGNAILSLEGRSTPLERSPVVFCSEDESWASYTRKIEEEGAIVEELIRLPGAASPSVQLRIAPDGSFEAISTHDQILGGPDMQVYLGCRFPAREEYRLEIQKYGLKIAEVLAAKGVVGPFGIDFVVVPSGNAHDIYLTEINLRLGGTTHPFFMARFVTGGVYDPTSGLLVADGRPKYYVASDNLKSDRYVGLSPAELIEHTRAAGLAYEGSVKTGITLHLMGALPGFGKAGIVCIGDSPDEAEDLHLRFTSALEELAARRRP